MISKISKISLVIIALFLAFKIFTIGYFLINKELYNNLSTKVPVDEIKIPDAGSRILVISPHPDDEIAGCYGFISKSLKNNCDIKVVFLTNGDGVGIADYLKYKITHPKPESFIKQGYKRQKETINAITLLGLKEDDIIFLGYPDRFTIDLWRTNWDYDNPFTSTYTNSNHSIYENSFTKNVPYSGNSLADDLEKIFTRYTPTHIVYPHFYDSHVDHFMTNNFVKYTIAKMDLTVTEITYLVHRGNWPTPPGYFPNLPLTPPKSLTMGRTQWYALPLSEADIKEKDKCLAQFKSQQENILMKFYLSSFLRKNELYGIHQDKDFQIGDTFLQPGNKCLISIINPFSDTLGGYLNKSADIEKLFVVLDEKTIKSTIKLIKPPRDQYQYLLYLIFFHEDDTVKRAMLSVENGKLILEKDSHNTIELPEGASSNIEGNHVTITLPYNDLDKTRAIFVNAVTYKNGKLIDRTGARLIKIRRLNTFSPNRRHVSTSPGQFSPGYPFRYNGYIPNYYGYGRRDK